MYVRFKFNGYRGWYYDYKSKSKYFKTIEDVFTYVDKYNTNCRMDQNRGTISDFKIINKK